MAKNATPAIMRFMLIPPAWKRPEKRLCNGYARIRERYARREAARDLANAFSMAFEAPGDFASCSRLRHAPQQRRLGSDEIRTVDR
jgi:hypothetical protein